MKEELFYREQKIVVFEPDVYFYLYNEDGDIDEYHCNSIEKAKKAIDDFYEVHNGFYDTDGQKYSD